MDDDKRAGRTAQQIIDTANTKALVHEINRTFANITGRPAPYLETHLSQPRPTSRKAKGSSDEAVD